MSNSIAKSMKEENLSETLKLYIKLIDSYSDCEVKGKNMLYTSLNVHMFSFISKDDTVGLRLPKEKKLKY